MLRQRLDQRQQNILRNKIDFGKDQENRAIETSNQREQEFVFARPVGLAVLMRFGRLAGGFQLHATAGVHQHQNHIPRLERLMNFLQHPTVEVRGRLVNARRVHKDNLRRGMDLLARGHLQHADDAVARRLRFGRDNGDLFARKGVHQRAFAGIGPAENGYKS